MHRTILDAAAEGNDPMHNDATLFMRGQGSPTYDPVDRTLGTSNDIGGGDLGFWDIDLWIGGLAEQPLFDGPLGTTFTMVMADFGQKMQDGDRFYYLYRMPVGQHLGDQIIGEQFADLIMRTTGLEHIGDAFGFQSASYTLDGYRHDNDYDGTFGALDADGSANQRSRYRQVWDQRLLQLHLRESPGFGSRFRGRQQQLRDRIAGFRRRRPGQRRPQGQLHIRRTSGLAIDRNRRRICPDSGFDEPG